MEALTHDALTDAIRNANTGDNTERLRGYGLNYHDLADYTIRQTPTLMDVGSAFITAILIGIELGRITRDPAFGAGSFHIAENPSKPHAFKGRLDRGCEICGRPDRWHIHNVHTDDLRGDADR